jgi:zinc transporter 1
MDTLTELNLCIGAFFNGVFLLALALSICLQSMERFVHVEVVNSPKLVLIIGCIGLGLNITSAIVVHGKRQLMDGCDSWNVKIYIYSDHHGHGHSHGPGVPADVLELRPVNSQRDLIVGYCIPERMCAF